MSLLMILGWLSQLHGLQILHILLQRRAQISYNCQILASFASRINRNRFITKQKTRPIGSIMLDKTRANKRMMRKILEQRSCRYRMDRKLLHVVIKFFWPSYKPAALSSKAAVQVSMRNPIAVECQVAIFLYYISDDRCYLKTANAFSVSKSSVSILIQKVSKIIVCIYNNSQNIWG